MVEIFGIDIAEVVNDSIANAGGLRDGSLAKTTPGTRTALNLAAGTNPTTTTHTFQGFVDTRETRRSGQVGAMSTAIVTIIGKSVLPLVVPEVNDIATIDSIAYNLLELLSGDPSGAVYEFRAEV